MNPFFVLPFKLLVVLASSNCGDHHFCVYLALCRPPLHQDWGRAGAAGNRLARDDKELGPSCGKQLPGEKPAQLLSCGLGRLKSAPKRFARRHVHRVPEAAPEGLEHQPRHEPFPERPHAFERRRLRAKRKARRERTRT